VKYSQLIIKTGHYGLFLFLGSESCLLVTEKSDK